MRVTYASLVALVFSVFSFAASNPVPLIYQPLIPTSVAPGHAAFTLTVHGIGATEMERFRLDRNIRCSIPALGLRWPI